MRKATKKPTKKTTKPKTVTVRILAGVSPGGMVDVEEQYDVHKALDRARVEGCEADLLADGLVPVWIEVTLDLVEIFKPGPTVIGKQVKWS